MNAPVSTNGMQGYRRKIMRKTLRSAIRTHRKRGRYDLANAAQELLSALKAGYPCPSFRGLGDAGEQLEKIRCQIT